MIATIHAGEHDRGKNLSRDKELIRAASVVVLADAPNTLLGQEIRELVIARWYKGRSAGASRIYCSVWIRSHGENRMRTGHGWASGGGYHKESAALESALESAGITLSEAIYGRGDGAIWDGLIAVAEAYGYPAAKTLIVEHS